MPSSPARAFNNLLSKKMPPRPKWDKKTREFALRLIANDAGELLAFMKKPHDYWKL